MKEFNMKINGNSYTVEVKEIEENIAKVEVNGTLYEVEMDKPMTAKKAKAPVVARQAAPSIAPPVAVAKPVASSGGANTIQSPLPGVILDLHVKEGDVVKVGQKLLTLEAMKMENIISSDRDGTVTALKVSKGGSVLEGDALIIIS